MNKPLSLALFCLLLPITAHADNPADERRRLLDEGSRQTQQYRESGWLDTEQARGEVEENDGYISIGGEIYQVGDTAEELESAIYHALNARQWHKVRQFAARYAKLPRHKPALIHLADALQKRDEGDFRAAGNSFQTALEAEPDNPRLLLEAGRFYAEDNQNKESAAAFEKVLKTDIPAETRPIVENYLSELGKRRRWHGQISLGYGYNSNVNQGNGINQCVWEIAGMCLMERTLPAPTDSTFSSYSATAEKTVPLKGITAYRCAVYCTATATRKKTKIRRPCRITAIATVRCTRDTPMPTHAPPFPCCLISNTTSATATPTTAHGVRMPTGRAHSPRTGALTHMPEQKRPDTADKAKLILPISNNTNSARGRNFPSRRKAACL